MRLEKNGRIFGVFDIREASFNAFGKIYEFKAKIENIIGFKSETAKKLKALLSETDGICTILLSEQEHESFEFLIKNKNDEFLLFDGSLEFYNIGSNKIGWEIEDEFRHNFSFSLSRVEEIKTRTGGDYGVEEKGLFGLFKKTKEVDGWNQKGYSFKAKVDKITFNPEINGKRKTLVRDISDFPNVCYCCVELVGWRDGDYCLSIYEEEKELFKEIGRLKCDISIAKETVCLSIEKEDGCTYEVKMSSVDFWRERSVISSFLGEGIEGEDFKEIELKIPPLEKGENLFNTFEILDKREADNKDEFIFRAVIGKSKVVNSNEAKKIKELSDKKEECSILFTEYRNGFYRLKISRGEEKVIDLYGNLLLLRSFEKNSINFTIEDKKGRSNSITLMGANSFVVNEYSKARLDKKGRSNSINLMGANSFVANEYSKVGINSKIEIKQNKNKGKNVMDKVFNSFMPSKIKEGSIALTMEGGIAIRNKDGSFVSFNKETKTLVDHMGMVFGEDKMSDFGIIMPVNKNQIKIGDVILIDNDFSFVSEIVKSDTGEDFGLRVVNASTASENSIVDRKNNFINAPTIKKLTTFFDMSGNTPIPDANSAGGMNPLMFLMMGDKFGSKTGGKDKGEMLKLMMMSQMMSGANNNQAMGGMNPMMMMMMFMDK